MAKLARGQLQPESRRTSSSMARHAARKAARLGPAWRELVSPAKARSGPHLGAEAVPLKGVGAGCQGTAGEGPQVHQGLHDVVLGLQGAQCGRQVSNCTGVPHRCCYQDRSAPRAMQLGSRRREQASWQRTVAAGQRTTPTARAGLPLPGALRAEVSQRGAQRGHAPGPAASRSSPRGRPQSTRWRQRPGRRAN